MPQILMGSARHSEVGAARAWRWTGRLSPNARFMAGELALWTALYGAYLGLRAIAIAGESRAFQNAHHVIGAEGALGLSHEAAAQRALQPAEPFFSTYYMLGFGPLILTALVWLAWRRRDLYRSLRTALLASIGIAAVVHLTFPVAPPRMIAGLGISDWVGLSGGHDTGSFAGIRFNPYAAMPSMHVGWSLLLGIVAWRALPGALKALGLLHPAMMTLAVTATGNHYLLDAVGGAAVAMAGLAVAGVLAGRPAVSGRLGDSNAGAGSPPGGSRRSVHAALNRRRLVRLLLSRRLGRPGADPSRRGPRAPAPGRGLGGPGSSPGRG